MTIAAKRFKFLDQETNVAIADLVNNRTSEIFNSPNVVVNSVSTELQSFVNTGKQAISPIVDTIQSLQATASGLIRDIKGMVGSLKDILDLPMTEIDRLVADLFPDDKASQTSFSKAIEKCKSDALKMGGIGKPYDRTINCNGNSRVASNNGCDSAQFNNILNKITGGQYNSKVNDLNGVLAKLMSLSKFGYDMNMCGVFSAVSQGVGNRNVLSRASGALVGNLAASKNTSGILDVVNSSVGLDTMLENPNSIVAMLETFTIPKEIKEAEYSNYADRTIAAAEILSDDWDTSSVDDNLSISNIVVSNTDLDQVFTSKVMDKAFDEDSLSTVIDDEFDFIHTANRTSRLSGLSRMDFDLGRSTGMVLR
ncbi:MAG: hypothetical protein M0Q87_14615 [Ottowia sp.]|nr:hypothetical protein [Ottowia sp.]